MGVPKQKWSEEEELALKAGIHKHGAGRWRTILKDPEFSGILYLRSNVDLKDKWRNMHAINGWGSRDKPTVAFNSSQHIANSDDNRMAFTTVVSDFSDGVVHANPLAMSTQALPNSGPKRSEAKLQNLIFEAIINLKEPTGSNKTAIAMYIEEQYVSPPDFMRVLSAKLKRMSEARKLIKVKRRYRIAPSSAFSRRGSEVLLTEGRQREPSRVDGDDIKHSYKCQVDAYIARLRCMTPQEAAAAAAHSLAEAEEAIAEAEEATRVAEAAEAAEADAEAAKAFAEAASLTIKNRNAAKIVWEWPCKQF